MNAGSSTGIQSMMTPVCSGKSLNLGLPLLEQLVQQFLEMLTAMSISGRLWVVEVGRIRVHHTSEEEG
jgi:hypothetical protein